MDAPRLFVYTFLIFSVSTVYAQTNQFGPQAAAPLQHVQTAKAFGSLLDLMEAEMMHVVRAMPADKYSFSPADLPLPEADFRGTRTFAEQVKHVAQANYSIFAEVGGIQPDRDVKSIEKLQTKDQIIAALADSIAFAKKAVSRLTPTDATAMIPGPELASRETMAAHGIAHAYDHYGQMVEYLRMNGIVPPGSRK